MRLIIAILLSMFSLDVAKSDSSRELSAQIEGAICKPIRVRAFSNPLVDKMLMKKPELRNSSEPHEAQFLLDCSKCFLSPILAVTDPHERDLLAAVIGGADYDPYDSNLSKVMSLFRATFEKCSLKIGDFSERALSNWLGAKAIDNRGAKANEIGVFLVQIGARQSRAEALRAFREIQGRFPKLLGGFKPEILRADLGQRGIWYRVGVGPMHNQQAATDFCNQLKSAGADCLIRRRSHVADNPKKHVCAPKQVCKNVPVRNGNKTTFRRDCRMVQNCSAISTNN